MTSHDTTNFIVRGNLLIELTKHILKRYRFSQRQLCYSTVICKLLDLILALLQSDHQTLGQVITQPCEVCRHNTRWTKYSSNQHQTAWFVTKMPASTQNCLVQHTNAQFDLTGINWHCHYQTPHPTPILNQINFPISFKRVVLKSLYINKIK